MVGDPAVGVDAAVVAATDQALGVVVGVAVLFGVLHVAEAGDGLGGGEIDVLGDPPVGTLRLAGGQHAVGARGARRLAQP